jgi:XTP/dITP diphosphohydrolase
MTPRIVIASTNRAKIREITDLLAGSPYEIVSLDLWPNLSPPEETGRTFAQNALDKARYYARATRALTVAEDSGLEIDALDGAPGVESARFGGAAASYPEKFALIFEKLRATGQTTSAARFVCALAVVEGERVVYETQCTVEGVIAREPRGAGGFGYDPIFYYPPYRRTLAEVTAEEKAAVSHRGQAFRALRRFLASEHRAAHGGPDHPPGPTRGSVPRSSCS